jgi:hypothetical protein
MSTVRHSYATSPGSPATGAMVTTSFISVPHMLLVRGNLRRQCQNISLGNRTKRRRSSTRKGGRLYPACANAGGLQANGIALLGAIPDVTEDARVNRE